MNLDDTEPRDRATRGVAQAAGLLIASLSVPGFAAAPVLCVPTAIGVPALSGPPNFLDPPTVFPNYWERVDDPRWRGSLSRSWPANATDTPHVRFRALRVAAPTPHLFLQWIVYVAPAPDKTADLIRVAFQTNGPTTWALEIKPHFNLVRPMTNEAPDLTKAAKLAGSAWSAWSTSTVPAWASTTSTRAWLDNSASPMWAVSMRVPMSNTFGDGHDLSGRFPVAFHLHVNHPTGVSDYRLDDGVQLLPDASMNTSPANWAKFDVAIPTSHPDCGDQIRIATSDVGTTNPASHRINLTSGNTFFIKPENVSGIPVGVEKIRAKIRLANWGTQASALWKEITPLDPSLEPTNTLGIPNGAKGNISFPWPLSPAERCEFIGTDGVPASENGGVAIPGIPSCAGPRTRGLHQCMLVELRGGGLIYNPDSVVRNMDFVNASTFERQAEVSVAGLPPVTPGARRNVYLHLQTFQMPGDVHEPARPSTMFDIAKVEAVLSKGDRDRARQPQPVASSASTRPPLGVDFGTLNQIHPTYLVHAFHETGETVTVDGVTRKVLEPQTSFGYYVHHDGPLSGWEAAIEGAERIAENYYRISVPENGAETINTRIVARQFAVWLGLGQTEPVGSFRARNKSGWAGTLGLEYLVADAIAVEGMLGVHHFGHRPGASDIDVTHLGIGGKWSWFVSGVTPFVVAGAGVYAFDPGSTKLGAYAGGGVQLSLAPAWQLEGRYLRHRVASNTPYSNYATLQIALRHEF